MTALATRKVCDVLLHLLDLIEHLLRVDEQGVTRRGEADLAKLSIKEFDAEFLFQLLNLQGDG
jgi:hypothetical protein